MSLANLTSLSFVTVFEPTFKVLVYDTTVGGYTTTGATITFTADSLRMSNIATEGPTKTAKGGLHAKTQVRYGKTMRVEMEDVVINELELTHLFNVLTASTTTLPTPSDILTGSLVVKDTFPGPLEIQGRTFIVSETGQKEWVLFTIHKFLPDGLLNLTMEAEGDVGVLNMSGEVQPLCGTFYSIGETTNPCV